MKSGLRIEDLSVEVEKKRVVSGVNLEIAPGEVHVIMGPNGSGKSSLALALMGHPDYRVHGKATLSGKNLLAIKPNDRAKLGLFLSFQNPIAVPGVTLGQLIWSSFRNINGKNIDVREFYDEVKKQAKLLGLKEEMLDRFVHDGFSGGEKKKAEILMLLSLSPKFVIFDEIDSGLDIDTLKKVANSINELVKKGAGAVLITHNQRILQYVRADFVHVLKEGKIIKSGNHKLAREIEEKGYTSLRGTSPRVTKQSG